MGFKEAVRTCLVDKYVTFSGRAPRSEYWWFVLFNIIVAVILMGLFFMLGGSAIMENREPPGIAWVPLVLYLVYSLGVLLPTISVTVRRFHDRNLSGWWYLALILGGMVPFVGFLASIAILVITVLKGTEGENKFGRDPLGPDSSAEVFA